MADLFYLPFRPAFDLNGRIMPGAKLDFYVSGTSTRAPVYTSGAMITPHPNPVTADAAGMHMPIYLDEAVTYRVVMTNAKGSPIGEYDPYTSGAAGIGFPGQDGAPGTNGGVGSSAGLAALFTAANGMAIGAGITTFQTSGYRAAGKGGARYVFDAAVNAAFVAANPRWSFLTADGRGFTLSVDQPLVFEMFGAINDYVSKVSRGTNNYPAWLAARAFLHAHGKAPTGNPYYKALPALRFGSGPYYMDPGAAPIAMDLIDGAYVLLGNGGYEDAATAFMIAEGKAGMVAQSWDTAGVSGVKVNTPSGASFGRLKDMSFFSLGGTLHDPDHVGVKVRCHTTIENVNAYDFGGDGVFVFGTTANPETRGGAGGNANLVKLLHCGGSRNGGAGIRVQGYDGNAVQIESPNCVYNLGFGLDDRSFLGCSWTGVGHTDRNGVIGCGPSWSARNTGTWCFYNGRNWRVYPGQEVLTSTQAPGTGGAWFDQGASPTASGDFPQWVSGMTFVSGGSAYCASPTALSDFSVYMEQNQPKGWLESDRSFGLGGFAAWDRGANLFANNGRFVSPTGLATSGDGGMELGPAALSIGPPGLASRQTIGYRDGGGDVFWMGDHLDASIVIAVTGPRTLRAFGRPAPVPYTAHFNGFAIGDRIVGYDVATPAPAGFAHGEFRFNGVPTLGGPGGWYRTADVWQPVGIVGAVQAAAVTDVPAAATLADVIAKVNELLATDRASKLRAS